MSSNKLTTEALTVLNVFLQSFVRLNFIFSLLAILSGLGAIFSVLIISRAFFSGATIFALYGLWLCWRLSLDVQLFNKLYEKQFSEQALDEALAWLTNHAVSTRTIDERWHGTKKIYYRLLVLIPLTGLLFCAGALLQ